MSAFDPRSERMRHFEYDAWANRSVLAALRSLDRPSPDAVRILAHIVAVEDLWWSRVRCDGREVVVWPTWDLEHCGRELDQVGGYWREYVTTVSEVDLVSHVEYVNSLGERWQSRVTDVLTQVLHHSTHHRGQIALLVRESGAPPPYVDYIHAVRQGRLG